MDHSAETAKYSTGHEAQLDQLIEELSAIRLEMVTLESAALADPIRLARMEEKKRDARILEAGRHMWRQTGCIRKLGRLAHAICKQN
jgi:hypothetical protein